MRCVLMLTGPVFCAMQAKAQDASYIEACASSLKMNDATGFKNEVLNYALLNFISQSSSENKDTDAKFKSVSQYGMFDGTYKDAKSKTDQLEHKYELHWTKEQSAGYAMRYLSAEGSSAFTDCVNKVFDKVEGLHVSTTPTGNKIVTVRAGFMPPVNVNETPRYRFRISSNGNLTGSPDVRIPASGIPSRVFSFSRLNPADELQVTIAVTSHDIVIDEKSTYVPPEIVANARVEGPVHRIGTEYSAVTCSGNGNGDYRKGNPISLRVQNPDGEFVASSIVPKHAVHETGAQGCGPNTQTIIDSKPNGSEPYRVITGHVSCEPGNDKNHFCDARGWIEADEIRKTTTVIKPPDNGVHRDLRLITQ
jgi:hypothetical protein